MSDVENPGRIKVSELIEKVHKGNYVIPYFQRGFEWTPSMVSELFESILQNYFAGLILLWELDPEKTKQEQWDPIWGADLRGTPEKAVLDGQQRLSALYYALYNPEKEFPNRSSYYVFYLDLIKALNGDYENIVTWKYFFKNYRSTPELINEKEKWIESGKLPLSIIMYEIPEESNKIFIHSNMFQNWINRFVEENQYRLPQDISYFDINNVFYNILNYEFISFPLKKERNMRDICNIFAKVNMTGMKLSTFDLMNAFLYPHGIHLRKKLWDELNNEILKDIDPRMNEYLLKLISLKKQEYCSSKYIYNLIPGEKIVKKNEEGKTYSTVLVENGDEFERLWKKGYKYAEKARQIIMNTGDKDFGAVKIDFIPNTTIIPVLGAILWEYSKQGEDIDNFEFRDLLERWYWATAISGDYSGSSDTIMSEDFRNWKKWIHNKEPIKRIKEVNKKYIQDLELKSIGRGTSLYKAIISMLALNEARDFFTGRKVGSGDYSEGNINDHHIFPKKAKGLSQENSRFFSSSKDSIVNRTLLLDETNKKISSRRPSQYIENMVEKYGNEEKVKSIFRKHLVNEKAYEYLKNNNFDEFILERERSIKKHIIEKLKLTGDGVFF